MLDSSSNKGTGVPCFPQASAAPSIAMPSRDRFYVELKPGETTFVSWKKLLKESQKPAGSLSSSSEPPAGAHPALEARIAPEVAKEKDPLPLPPNRFNSVIEKIERLYQGENSDDEARDYMDEDKYVEDKYDTRDSFIDDTELDDYFSVENARLKHSGFFINKGKLEEEESVPTFVGPKKRKRKELKKLSSNPNEDEAKLWKSVVRLKAAARGGPSPTSGLGSPCKAENSAEKKKKSFRGPGWEMGKTIAMAIVEKELNGSRANEGLVSSDKAGLRIEGKRSVKGMLEDRMIVDSVAGSMNGKDLLVGLIDINEPLEKDVASFEQRESISTDGFKQKSIQRVVKEGEMKEPMSSAKRLALRGKEGSPPRNKGSALEKAFLDLKNDVAELYPPSLVVKEPEQGKRNRLPRDLKQKLAKVARLSAKQGRITEEMIERLMGILGHVIRERTLKRHLKAMIDMGVSTMHEKEGRLQGIKEEVTELIKLKVHMLQAQEVSRLNEFQLLSGSPEKAAGEGRYQWDDATEDKICSLYEKYIEGMGVNKGPHIRKLYAELAELWPDGWMDNIGIKLAVHRAKERKRKLIKASNSCDAKRRGRPKSKVEDSSADGLTLLQLFTPGSSSDHSLAEKLKCHGHELQLLMHEKKVSSSRHGSAEGESKSMDEALLMRKRMKNDTEKSVTTRNVPVLPFNMSNSMLHTSFGSPLPVKLPLEAPVPSSIGSINGAFSLPSE